MIPLGQAQIGRIMLFIALPDALKTMGRLLNLSLFPEHLRQVKLHQFIPRILLLKFSQAADSFLLPPAGLVVLGPAHLHAGMSYPHAIALFQQLRRIFQIFLLQSPPAIVVTL